ncbi:tail fiber assembly protein [Lelliottia nimipressuralis]|uniref:Tail fiber assembly protein n=2 Tax=Lelliottia nimipressuralis TaxID=69220 RepID=A0ABY3P7W4_9ENTR|nr:phage tail protein [Lelliottia nimipressuralis]TYT35218.1 tail fiber assembly protein [Lelliottia nimipressuralis]
MEKTIPFTASIDDSTSYGVKIYEEALAGVWGSIQPFVDASMSQENMLIKNNELKSQLMEEAEIVITPLSRAAKYGIATDKELSALEQWELYTVELNRVNPSCPDWPDIPDKKYC